jgi:hypothetical protein
VITFNGAAIDSNASPIRGIGRRGWSRRRHQTNVKSVVASPNIKPLYWPFLSIVCTAAIILFPSRTVFKLSSLARPRPRTPHSVFLETSGNWWVFIYTRRARSPNFPIPLNKENAACTVFPSFRKGAPQWAAAPQGTNTHGCWTI